MPDLVAPPDIEGMAVAYLSPLVSASVGTRFPHDGEGGVIRVSAGTGSVTGLVLATPRLVVECWGTSTVEARDLAATVHAHLCAWADCPPYRVTATLPVNFPDVNRPTLSRYQFLATAWTRMESL